MNCHDCGGVTSAGAGVDEDNYFENRQRELVALRVSVMTHGLTCMIVLRRTVLDEEPGLIERVLDLWKWLQWFGRTEIKCGFSEVGCSDDIVFEWDREQTLFRIDIACPLVTSESREGEEIDRDYHLLLENAYLVTFTRALNLLSTLLPPTDITLSIRSGDAFVCWEGYRLLQWYKFIINKQCDKARTHNLIVGTLASLSPHVIRWRNKQDTA